MFRSPRLGFRAVDATPTPGGRIVEAACYLDSTGTGWDQPRHFATRALILLVRGGGSYRDTRGLETTVGPGDLILVHPALGHVYGPPRGGAWDEFFVCYEGPLFDALEAVGVSHPDRPVLRLGDPAPWRARLTRAFPAPGRRVGASEQLGELIAFLLAAHARAAAPLPAPPDWLVQARQLLALPGPAGPVDLRAVARACGLGYEVFRKRFAERVGESPTRFRRRVLIAHAQRLMRERDLPDRAIADALGFCDEFHFSKMFKQACGLSPRAWRAAQPAR